MTQLTGFNIPAPFLSDKEQRILKVMRVDEWMTTKQIAHAYGCLPKTITISLDRLRVAGYVASGPRMQGSMTWRRLSKRATPSYGELSTAEQKVLDIITKDMEPAEIELRSGLPKHTVHIALRMLKCRGILNVRRMWVNKWARVPE